MSVEWIHPERLWLAPVCLAAVLAAALVWRSRLRRDRLSLALRIIMVLLTVLALAGTSVLMPSPDRAAWLLVDASASMQEEEALALAREALEHADDRAENGVIVFGENAAVERSLGQQGSLDRVDSMIGRGGSNLGEALRLAAALLPTGAEGGIAVISDGMVQADERDIEAAEGIPVNILKTSRRSGTDAQVTEVSVPSSLYTGQKYAVTVTIHASDPGPATLILSENRSRTQTREVSLRRGENIFVFESRAGDSSGVATVDAQIMMEGDTVPANDANGAFTVISGSISVLIAEGKSGEGSALKRMLEASGMRAAVLPAAMLPAAASELWAYQAVALVNVNAADLSGEQISALDQAARELGVGVAVFGGDSSFALGEYRGSALEKMLPVTIDVKNRETLPSTALVLVIDKSGSMMEEQFGVSRLQLAREAASAALEVLSERDMAGVIAFDDEGKWVVPLGPVDDVPGMQDMIGTIRVGGGTAFYTPLAMAQKALKGVSAQYRHVIFLTDGEAGDTGYEELVRMMARDGITLTTVAVGDGADYAGMRKLAELGGGRMYAAGPYDSLPRIFTKETMMISQAYVRNQLFTPVVTDSSMTGFEGFPPLEGYLASVEKPLATVSLCSDREDPVLAWWQYGAGRVLAWTSDITGGWSGAFLDWDQAVPFFAGMISFIVPERSSEGEVSREGSKLIYQANVPDESTQAEAVVLKPDGERETVLLERVSADTFEGEADFSQRGAYSIRVSAKDRAGRELSRLDTGTVVSWTGEYDQRARDDGFLEALSERTGGRIAEDAAGLMHFTSAGARRRTDLRGVLLTAALLLFLMDIAQRRLNWVRERKREEQPPRGQKKGKEKKKARTEKARETQKQAETTEVLWQNLQKKKRL